MSPVPQRCDSREALPEDTQCQLHKRSAEPNMQQRERKKKKIPVQLHTLFLLSEQPPSGALERINFKGHRKMLTDLRRAGPLCVHTFHCHQHKIRCLGSRSNCSDNVVIKAKNILMLCTKGKKKNLVSCTSIMGLLKQRSEQHLAKSKEQGNK